MTERNWSIAAVDGKSILGILNTSTTQKNNKAILFIHGLTGHPYEYAPNVMAQTFPDLGYDVIRPYLYCGGGNSRDLIDCTIATHAQDVNSVATHFKNHYTELFAIGHSYGGPSVMSGDCNQFKGICLWDPTYNCADVSDNGAMPKLGDYFVLKWGTDHLMGKAMHAERLIFDKEFSRKLAQKCTVPLQVIFAGDGRYVKEDESYHTHAKGITNSVIVPGSRHCFYEEGTTEPLLQYTKDWFDKFSR